MTRDDRNENSRVWHNDQLKEKFERLRQSIQELTNGDTPIEVKASVGLRVGHDGEPDLFAETELKVLGTRILK